MNGKMQITPTVLKIGVFTLPAKVCKEWKANSRNGRFHYNGIVSDITITPKHIDYLADKATAWQFTVNNSVQFAQLKLDGAHTYIEEKASGEYLNCIFEENADESIDIKVESLTLEPETKAIKKVRALLAQGIREKKESASKAPLWNNPSGWIDFSEIDKYKDVKDCIYIWTGKSRDLTDDTTYLYVGIVGATAKAGESKRTLKIRLSEEKAEYLEKHNVDIKQFRFCSLNSCDNFDVPILLKTIEMSSITVLTSLFNCDKAQEQIEALFKDEKVKLLNSMTSYKYVK